VITPTRGARRLAIVAVAVLGTLGLGAQRAAPTHWEQYKTQKAEPQRDQRMTDPILFGAVDLHVHPDPDVYPRQADAFEVVKLARDRGMRGVVLKNHFSETASLAYLARKYATPGFAVFGGIALNLPVGGINPQAVRYMIDVEGGYGRIVWFPTHDSEHEVRFNKENRPFVRVSQSGKLLPQVHEVLALIAEHDLVLATGHVTPEETLLLLRAGRAAGVKRLIVTHPMFAPQYTWMSIDQLRTAADLGAYIEITGNSLVRDAEAKPRVVAAVKAIGASHFVVSTDSGLVGTPNITDTLATVAKAFRADGISEADLNRMFKVNPAFLLGLP
jgi:uncharacterized protein DUF6282